MNVLNTTIKPVTFAVGAALLAAYTPQAPAQSLPNPAQAEAVSAAAPALLKKDDKIEEVVVTATRRKERLQNVPLAVTAVKADDLQSAGIKDLSSIVQAVPGLDFTQSASAPGFKVRGIGAMVAGTYFTNAELPVGVVVDGVIQGIGPGLNNLGEVERIEVLKGPQGTQFGKNSAAGAINVTTKKPVLNSTDGSVYASYGNLNQYEVRASANLPIGTVAAVRASAFKSGYDGYINNIPSDSKIGGDRQKGGMLKFLVEPNKSFDIQISVDASNEYIVGGSNTRETFNSTFPGFSGPAGLTPGLGNLDNYDVIIGEQSAKRSGASLELNYRVNDYTLTSLTAYRKLDTRDWGGGGGGLDALGSAPTPFGALFTSDALVKKSQSTQELRVTSPSNGRLEYVAGYLYYKQPSLTLNSGGFILPNPVGGSNWLLNSQNGLSRVDTTVDSNAVFADGKINLDPSNAILLGLRYTKDKVVARFDNPIYNESPLGSAFTMGGLTNPPLFGPPGGMPAWPTKNAEVDSNKLTYKIGANHKFDANNMVFATYSTGYLGPVINYEFNSQADLLKPQTNKNITVGYKSQFLDRKLTFNIDMYQDKYVDFQTGYFNSKILQFIGENAASMTTRGLEIETAYRAAQDLSLAASLAYVDARYDNYCSVLAAGFGVPDCTSPTGTGGGQVAGQSLSNVPKLSSTITINYASDALDGYRLTSSANYYYRTNMRIRSYDPLTETPSYGVLGANLGLSPNSGAWKVSLYGRNLFNKRAPSVEATGLALGYVNYVVRDTLRAVGISLDVNF